MALANIEHLDVHQEVQETLTALGPGIAYSRLLRLRMGPPEEVPQPSLLLECELCLSWQMVDPLTYRFQLREGTRWQDIPPVNGRELVADDVVYSYERQLTPGWANASLLQNMESVEAEAEGRYTLKITLKPEFADADFLLSLADGHTKVVAREAVDVKGDLKEGPVIGSGPWIWRSTREDFGSVFEKNPDYFERGLPFLDELVISIVRGKQTRLAAFEVGSVDAYRISPSTWQELVPGGTEFPSFVSFQAGTGLILTMNVSAPPFDNLQVRKAVLKAIDPWDYVRRIWSGQGYVSTGIPVQRPDWLLTREEMRGTYFADPEIAERMLSQAGVATPVKFDLMVADFGDLYLRQGNQIQEDLNAAGFDPFLVKVNASQYGERVWRDKDYQLAIGELPPTSTSNSYLFGALHSASPQGNVVAHSDSQLDAMIVEQAVERDPAARKGLLREIQRYLLDQAYLFSPVTGGARWVHATRVKGFYPNTAVSEYFYWAKAWVE